MAIKERTVYPAFYAVYSEKELEPIFTPSSLSDLISINEKMPKNDEICTFKSPTFQYLKLQKKEAH
jgi:hypothetical protein